HGPACASCTGCLGRSLPRPRSRRSGGCTVETTSPTRPACVRSNTSWMTPSPLVKNILEDATTILTEGDWCQHHLRMKELSKPTCAGKANAFMGHPVNGNFVLYVGFQPMRSRSKRFI